MKRDITVMVLGLLLLSLQGALLRGAPIRMDLITLIIVYLALERGVLSGAVVAAMLGYVSDVFAGTDRGLHTLSMVLLFFVIRLLVARVVGGRFVFVTLVSVLATLICPLVLLLVEAVVGQGTATFAATTPGLGVMLIIAAGLGYPLYRLLKAIDDRLREPEDDYVFGGQR